jgi:hypothetical protein
VQARTTLRPRPLPAPTRWSFGGLIWAVLAVFGAGCWATIDFFPTGEDRGSYAVYTFAATLACAMFIFALRGSASKTLPHWILFGIFVWGYYVQFYWLLLLQDKPSLGVILAASMTPTSMLDVYRQSTTAFFLSALTLNVVRLFQAERAREDEEVPVTPETRLAACRVGILLGAVIFVATTVLMAVFGFGSPTRELHAPFRMAGWVLQSRRTLLPAVLLMVISFARDVRLRGYLGAALAILVASALADMILITTRGGLLIGALLWFSVLAVQGRLSKQVWTLMGVAVLATGGLFPLISRLRDNRVGGMQTYDAVQAAQLQGKNDEADEESVLSPFMRRFSGASMLIPIVNINARTSMSDALTGFYDSEVGVTAYNTIEVFGYKPGGGTGVAPSLLGWFYIAGGELGVGLGSVILVVLLSAAWQLARRLPLRTRPVLQALFATYLITRLSDGTLEDVLVPACTIGGSVLSLELLLKFLERVEESASPVKRGSSSAVAVSP